MTNSRTPFMTLHGFGRWRLVHLIAVTLAVALHGQCKDRLVQIEIESVQTKYCIERGGGVAMHLRLHLQYSSRASFPILVPVFARASAYTLFHDTGAVQLRTAERRVACPKPSALETPKLPSQPTPESFSTLAPGGTLERTVRVVIPVAPVPGGSGVSPASEHYIEIEIDHWPRARQPIDDLRKEWRRWGYLLTEKVVTSPPIEIRVAKSPVGEPCWMQID